MLTINSIGNSIVVLFVLVFCLTFSVHASPLYLVEKPGGVKMFTNRKPIGSGNYRVVKPTLRRISRITHVIRSSRYGSNNYSSNRYGAYKNSQVAASAFNDLISDAALRHGVEAALVKAVVHVESAFNPDATSPKGAMGLMQLMPGTAERFGVSDAYHPSENVEGGVRYLRLLLDRYHGNRILALAAYNAGEGAVDQTKGIPPYAETKDYVKKVLEVRSAYLAAPDKPADTPKQKSSSEG